MVLAAEVGAAIRPSNSRQARGDLRQPSTAVTEAAESSGRGDAAGSSGDDSDAVASALRRYEARRSTRCLPLTVKSNLMGVGLQSDFPPICIARDIFIQSPLFSPAHFLDSARYDVAADLQATRSQQSIKA